MGKRVHVIKKHEEYGKTKAFNWKFEEFNHFIGFNLGCKMRHMEYNYNNVECKVEEYETALSLVKAYKEKGRCEEVEKMFDEANGNIDCFEGYLEILGGIDYILSSMQAFYNERDKESSWISFSAWW